VVRFVINFVVSTAILLAYVSLGAMVFQALESKVEEDNKKEGQMILKDFSVQYNLTSDNVTQFLRVFKKLNEFNVGIGLDAHLWSFEGAFYFCTTAITTIGTGNITPSTRSGQWFCIFYVLMGIPVLSLFFGLTGYYLTQLIRMFLLKVETWFNTRLNIYCKQVLALVLIWIVGWVCLALYALWISCSMSHWSFGESVYYSFTTFSTIGFGDYTTYNGETDEFPLMITSFIVLTLMLPVASLMFSISAEFFQTLLCPAFLRVGLVKRSELQRIIAEDQILYRYRKMRKEMRKESVTYNTFAKWDDMNFPESSITSAVLEASLRYREWYLPNEIVGINTEREGEVEAEKGYMDVNVCVKKSLREALDKDLIIDNSLLLVRRRRANSF